MVRIARTLAAGRRRPWKDQLRRTASPPARVRRDTANEEVDQPTTTPHRLKIKLGRLANPAVPGLARCGDTQLYVSRGAGA
ncbi:hypothetical protein GCM10010313_32950 [Streptomyces violarus]|nr:hypothetical protein GCM10010313_32950 [Streptomyces violarus]